MAIVRDPTVGTFLQGNWSILLLVTVAITIGIRLIPSRANVPVYSRYSGWRGRWKDSLHYLHDSAGTLRAGYEKVTSKDCLNRLILTRHQFSSLVTDNSFNFGRPSAGL
jgi:hypothetical protein